MDIFWNDTPSNSPSVLQENTGQFGGEKAVFSSHSSRPFLLAPVQSLTISNLWPTICTGFSQISV